MDNTIDEQIEILSTESARGGDILQSAICERALERDYADHDLTAAERARVDAMTANQARVACYRALADAQANARVIAAIGTNGCSPVVWGLGDTEDAAKADADSQCEDERGWQCGGHAYVEVTPGVAALIEDGVVDPADLGIEVTCNRDGLIDDARVID